MKKLFLLLCFFAVTVSGFSQEWSMGSRLGMNVSNRFGAYYSYKESYESKKDIGEYTPGLRLGMFGEYKHRDFAVEADVLYSMEGVRVLNDVKRTHNLLVPIKMKYYISCLASGLNVYAGPQLGIHLAGSNWITNKASFAVVGGVGYKFKFGMDLSAGYAYEVASQYKSRDIRNSVFNISMGWSLFQR